VAGARTAPTQATRLCLHGHGVNAALSLVTTPTPITVPLFSFRVSTVSTSPGLRRLRRPPGAVEHVQYAQHKLLGAGLHLQQVAMAPAPRHGVEHLHLILNQNFGTHGDEHHRDPDPGMGPGEDNTPLSWPARVSA